jgi:NAD(P)H dehydrogenase (quinone)
MRVFIVHAHPEPESFNGALTRTASETLRAHGHEVIVSDRYAAHFNPVSDRRNFVTVHDANYFRQQAEEAYAATHNGFVPEIAAEMEKLFWCDALILQFPLWWFGLPAILKGWVDRVFASGGRIYGGGKWYDRGVFSGKRAMCSVTIGGMSSRYSERGLNGPIAGILRPRALCAQGPAAQLTRCKGTRASVALESAKSVSRSCACPLSFGEPHRSGHGSLSSALLRGMEEELCAYRLAVGF